MTFPRWLWVALGLPFGALLLFVTVQPLKVLPRIALAPGFTLTDQAGQTLTNEDLRGALALYSFTYTRCEGACPQSGPLMADLQARLATRSGSLPVHLVTLSFDPLRDNQAARATYAERYGAEPERWHVVTGESALVKQMVGGSFGVYYTPNTDGSFTFEPAFVLVDGWGIIRAEYRSASPSPERILRDIALLESEARHSQGVARYAYEAAHLFLCYPQ